MDHYEAAKVRLDGRFSQSSLVNREWSIVNGKFVKREMTEVRCEKKTDRGPFSTLSSDVSHIDY